MLFVYVTPVERVIVEPDALEPNGDDDSVDESLKTNDPLDILVAIN